MNVQVLTREQCLARLRAGGVGRVATTHRALPTITPVRYTWADGEVLFPAAGDAALAHGCDGCVVAFEIDEVRADGRSGWSVMVVGPARLAGDWIAIEVGTITGRAVGDALSASA